MRKQGAFASARAGGAAWLSLLLVGLLAPAAEGSGVVIDASADRTIARIGDAITYRVTVRYDSTLALLATRPEVALGAFEVRDHRAEEAESDPGRLAVTEEFVLSCYLPGHREIGVRPYLVQSPSGQVDTLVTAAIPVEIVSTLPPDATDIRDIRGPAEIPSRVPVRWLALGAGVAAAAGIGVWLVRRRRHPRAIKLPPPRPPHEVAYETLEALRRQNLPGSGQLKAYYIALSETLRRYLGARFGLPAMDRTTSELLHALRLTEGGRGSLRDIASVLGVSDWAKFARWLGTLEDAEENLDRAVRVVDRTRERPGEPEPEVARASAGGQG